MVLLRPRPNFVNISEPFKFLTGYLLNQKIIYFFFFENIIQAIKLCLNVNFSIKMK